MFLIGKLPFIKNIRRSESSNNHWYNDKPCCCINWWAWSLRCPKSGRLIMQITRFMSIGALPRATWPSTIIDRLNKIGWFASKSSICNGIRAFGISGGLAWPKLNSKRFNGASNAKVIKVPAAAHISAHCLIGAKWSFVNDQFDKSISHE